MSGIHSAAKLILSTHPFFRYEQMRPHLDSAVDLILLGGSFEMVSAFADIHHFVYRWDRRWMEWYSKLTQKQSQTERSISCIDILSSMANEIVFLLSLSFCNVAHHLQANNSNALLHLIDVKSV